MNQEERQEVKALLEAKIDEVFCERQAVYGIKSGDISPLDAVKLEAITDMLAEHIATVLMREVAYGG